MKSLIQILITIMLPTLAMSQNVLGFHEAQSESRGDWIAFSLRGKTFWVNPDAALTVTSVPIAHLYSTDSAASVVESAPARNALLLMFSESDRVRFADLTTRATGRRIAILHRGELLAAPNISAPVSDGRVIIHGIQNQATARGIVAALTTPQRHADTNTLQD